ncbi:hypothetical protein [Amycolatopsis sp. NBRC 101858]|uniref:hypothetical protein n=1 Tax=Amycolatopsis sp. NBRC 101858 TaxID=3032200 RepID=UPI002554DEB1|nr:hypothetical protein [Amycolatopsis sp. NBRC 101858]
MLKKTLIGLTAAEVATPRAATSAAPAPREYTATFTCSDGRKAARTFTVPTTPPPTTSMAAEPAKPQVTVKPAGAPQTGDGSPS